MLCLLIPALYNGYPLMTSDSGAYINNGWIIQIPQDRPIGYSIFIRLSSLGGMTLWGVVIAQALLLAFFMRFMTRQLLGDKYRSELFLGIALLVGGATSAGWFCGQIMPDIFTAILLFALWILFCIPLQKKEWRWALYALLLACNLFHNSNLLVTLSIGLIILLYARLGKKVKLYRPVATLLIIGATGWILLSSMTAIAGRGFRPSSSAHVFIMSRMVENGILEKYLNRYCEKENFRLCAWRGKLPDRQWNFMWDDAGPFAQTGGWTESEEEYNRIIIGTLTHPDFLWMHVWKNSLATLRQLPLWYVGDGLTPFGDQSNPYWKVQQYFGDELKEYRSSLQQTGELRLTGFNVVIMLFALLVMAMSLLARDSGQPTSETNDLYKRSFKLIFLFLIINAAITATFSTVVGRFQSRVSWVLVFLCLVYLVNILIIGRESKRSAI